MTQEKKQIYVPQQIHMKPLQYHEDRLLSCLAFFRTNRVKTTQAHHCLSMYLRQGESRVMSEVAAYARIVGIDPWDLSVMIQQNPDEAEKLLGAYLLPYSPSDFHEDFHETE